MRIQPDCIVCALKACLASLHSLSTDEVLITGIFSSILEIPSVRGQDWSLTSPEVFELAISKIMTSLGNPDPFLDLKNVQNQKALALYAWLKTIVEESPNQVETAIKLAIAGNAMDWLMFDGQADIVPLIRDALSRQLPPGPLTKLIGGFKESELILYFGDNCGEGVMDRLLIETVKQRRSVDVVYVVRDQPTFNDLTLTEARYISLDQVAHLRPNGIDGPLPGTILSRSSPEIQDLFQRADLVISKGGGNHDSLDEVRHLKENLAFLFVAKCRPYCRRYQVDMYQSILDL